MFKKLVCLFAIVFMVSTSAAFAATSEDLLEGMGKKLVRGVVNTFTGWVELPAQIIKGYNNGFMDNEDNKIVGAVVGIFKGLGHSAGRTISGVSDLGTFWAADPEDNIGVGLRLDAEYAWEEGVPEDIFDPNLTEGALVPIGNKILRGLGNSFLGIAEVPGQIIKGTKAGAPDLGIVKGVWYWISRQANGAYNLSTFFLPNPEDTKALPFDEKWPWDALADNV